MQTLTKAQAHAFAYIVAHVDQHGYGPTFRKISDALGMASVSSAHRLVTELEKRGVLVSHPEKYRQAAAYEFAPLPPLPKAEYYLRVLIDQIDQMGEMKANDDLYIRIRKVIEKADNGGTTQ